MKLFPSEKNNLFCIEQWKSVFERTQKENCFNQKKNLEFLILKSYHLNEFQIHLFLNWACVLILMKTVIGSMWKVPQKLNSRKQTYYFFPSYCCWFQCEIDVLQVGDDFKVKDFSGVSNKMFEEENWRSKLFFYFHKSLFSGLKDLIIYMEYLWTCHKEAFLCWNCSVKSLVTLTWMRRVQKALK